MSTMDWPIRRFTGIENQVHEWTRQFGGKADGIFYTCMYDAEFERCNAAPPRVFLHRIFSKFRRPSINP
jgi:hypothetical protein